MTRTVFLFFPFFFCFGTLNCFLRRQDSQVSSGSATQTKITCDKKIFLTPYQKTFRGKLYLATGDKIQIKFLSGNQPILSDKAEKWCVQEDKGFLINTKNRQYLDLVGTSPSGNAYSLIIRDIDEDTPEEGKWSFVRVHGNVYNIVSRNALGKAGILALEVVSQEDGTAILGKSSYDSTNVNQKWKFV